MVIVRLWQWYHGTGIHDNITIKWPFPWERKNFSHGNVTNFAWEWSFFDNLCMGNCSIWQLTHGNRLGKSSKITKFLSQIRLSCNFWSPHSHSFCGPFYGWFAVHAILCGISTSFQRFLSQSGPFFLLTKTVCSCCVLDICHKPKSTAQFRM